MYPEFRRSSCCYARSLKRRNTILQQKTATGTLSIGRSSGRRRMRPSCPALKLREVASMYLTMLAVFLVVLVAALQGTDPPENSFPYRVPLDPEGVLELSWNVSYPLEEVHFQILARELKYGLIFGMSDRGDFENADLAVLWSNGVRSYFADAWSDQKGRLHMDSQQNYKLLGAHKAPEGLYLLFKRPFGTCDPKDYLIEYEPVITEGNEAIVHHMEIFQCAASFETFPRYSGPCDSKMKPERLNYCRHVLAAWAMGAQAFYYPEEAGLAFGGPSSSRYLRLEVHYHNPLKLKDHRDSSGIRLYYTASLRPNDAGIMELGLVYTPVMAIPPGESSFNLTGYCTDKCTEMALPETGIHVFASQLHTHLTGRRVVTVLSRQGREQEILNIDNHYSPHFQEIRMLKKIVHVFPGDVLTTTCTYNTEERTQATVGGFSITEEMCVNYIHYYPRTELELCKSAIDLGYLRRYFSLVNRFDDEEVCTCPETSVTQQFSSVPWNSFNRDVLKSLYDFAPISVHCNKSSAVQFPGEWEKQPLPTITERLPDPAPHCEHDPHPLPTTPALVKLEKAAAK
ncbi:dopamine beta-hydroxylase isoform X6 [Hemicordylus capensis]|uniref:dopamine beta-hydroxylase isoform X6 n=1 Tax=Hemicordylus capensis TaxID=884348 RepID=UPI002302560F|nr:dopamine beta-hydroxylase isoform X6 [Hemicordylus capensis]